MDELQNSVYIYKKVMFSDGAVKKAYEYYFYKLKRTNIN